MSEIYYGGYDRCDRRRRRSLAGLLFHGLLTLLTAVTIAGLVLGYLSPYVDPAHSRIIPLLGLAAPGFYIAALLLMLYWIVVWRWIRASLLLVTAAAGLFRVPLFYKFEFRRDYGTAEFDRSTITLLSFNVRRLYGDDGQSSADALCDLIERIDPDVVCLQEFNASLAGERFERLLDGYAAATFGRREPAATQQMILSKPKYRIVKSGTTLDDPDDRFAAGSVWADLLVREDTVRLFNHHLHSTAITASDDDYLTSRSFLSDSTREEKLRSIADRFVRSSAVRAAQADSIAAVMRTSRYERIVCGDFNDTPMSYVYRRMARGMNDAFRVCGKGFSSTYRGFGRMLRIDYVLSSDGFETLSYEVPEVRLSDHLPVVVRLKYNGRTTDLNR